MENERPQNRSKDTHKSSTIGHFLRRIRPRSKSPATAAIKGGVQTSESLSNTTPRSVGYAGPSSMTSEKKGASRKKSDRSSTDVAGEETPRNPFGGWLLRLSGRRGIRATQSPLRDQDQRGAVSEEDLVSKSLATEIEKNIELGATSGAAGGLLPTTSTTSQADYAIYSPMLSSYYSQDSVFENTNKRTPSYIRVSCALSGYRNYRPLTHSPLIDAAHRSAPSTPSTDNSLAVFPSGLTKPKQSSPNTASLGKSIVERRLEKFTSPASDHHQAETSPHARMVEELAESTPTPVKELVNNFKRLSINSTEKAAADSSRLTGVAPKRPAQRPPPVPADSALSDTANLHAFEGGLENGNVTTTGFVSPQLPIGSSTSYNDAEGGIGRNKPEDGTSCVLVVSSTDQFPSSISSHPPALSSFSSGRRRMVSDVANAVSNATRKQTNEEETEAAALDDVRNGKASAAHAGNGIEEWERMVVEEAEQGKGGGSLLDEVMSAVRQSEEERLSTIVTDIQSPDVVVDQNHFVGLQQKMAAQNGHAVHDGAWYQQSSLKEREALTQLKEAAQKDLDTVGLPDEAVGMIDVAIGKARLLMEKKMKKFDELVSIHLDPSTSPDGKIVKLDDLEGYWQLVEMELEDVRQCFSLISDAKKDNWTFPSESPPATSPKDGLTSHGRPKSLVGRMTSTTTVDEAKEADRRKRIREMKAKAKQKLQQQNGTADQDVQIFVPTSPH